MPELIEFGFITAVERFFVACSGCGVEGSWDSRTRLCPDCEQESEARAEREYRRQSWMQAAGIPERYRSVDRVPKVLAGWDGEPWCLHLWGSVGPGKTYQATAVFVRLFETDPYRFRDAYWVDCGEALRGSMDDKQARLQRMEDCSLLLLDDLGATHNGSWANEEIEGVLRVRYNRLRPTLTTSNLLLDKDESQPGKSIEERYPRFRSRLHEGRSLRVTGEDRRRAM